MVKYANACTLRGNMKNLKLKIINVKDYLIKSPKTLPISPDCLKIAEYEKEILDRLDSSPDDKISDAELNNIFNKI